MDTTEKEQNMKPALVLEEKFEDNVLPFRLLPGGKEPPDEESPHWLRNVPENWVFQAAQHGAIPAVMFQIVKHFDQTTLMFDMQHQLPALVHTARFSKGYQKLQVDPVIKSEKEEEDGSDHPTGQGLDQRPAPAEGQH